MNVIYIDRLSFFSLIKLVVSRINYLHIFYFNMGYYSGRIAKLLKMVGVLRVSPKLAEFQFGDMRDDNGEFTAIRVAEDKKDICLEISKKEFAKNSFLRGFSRHLDFKKILNFIEKVLAIELNEPLIFINAARWHAKIQRQAKDAPNSIKFFLEKGLWSAYFGRYATSLNIEVVGYRTIVNSSYLNFLGNSRRFIFRKIKIKLNNFSGSINADSKKNASVVDLRKDPFIGAYYTGRQITFDLNKRSDFFWLLRSDIPRYRVLVYFDRFDAINIPISEEKVDILKNAGVNFIAVSNKERDISKLEVWYPGKNYKRTKSLLIKSMVKGFLLEVFRLNIVPFFYISYMLYFAEKYSYWFDFFASYNIKINICPHDYQVPYVPQAAAIEKNGGLNISYQFSNHVASSITLSSSSSIMFSFGPAYRWVWERNGSSVDKLIYCGYITDYSFKEVKSDSIKLREKIIKNGAQFIICLFDENSSDGRLSSISNEHSAQIYRYFIEKMLKDKTLGLIFKPKFPWTIYKRLSSISSLIQNAKETGRCVFIDKGEWFSEQLPTEAAQAADLCIGSLYSGTVMLESFLSGTPSVFIDLEGLYSDQVYKWGRDKVVFDDLNELFSAIDDYRQDPQKKQGFGDLSSWVKDKDPFRDGNASLRMGQYINWLLEAFSQGKEEDEAILYADGRYTAAWGKNTIVNMKGCNPCSD